MDNSIKVANTWSKPTTEIYFKGKSFNDVISSFEIYKNDLVINLNNGKHTEKRHDN